MKITHLKLLIGGMALLACAVGAAQPEIKNIKTGPNRELLVNGQPFFPIMGWLQNPENLPKLKAVGINTIAGYYWDATKKIGPGGTKNAAEYGALAQKAGLYFVSPYLKDQPEAMQQLRRSGNLLAWIHNDEPDLPLTVSDAEIVPGPGLIINGEAPLWKIFDGKPGTSAVLDPMAGAQVTIKLKKPVTVRQLSVWVDISPKIAVAKEVIFESSGKEFCRATLKEEKGEQKLELPARITFQELTFKVLSTYPRENKWGFVSEIAAFDDNGTNVLLSPPRQTVNQMPAEVRAHYQTIKAFDPMHPVMMTVTGFFINDSKAFDHWCTHEQADQLYPELLKWADFPGFDQYPIYGWNRPEKLFWVAQGVKELRNYAGQAKPLYAWIETQAGSFGSQSAPVTGVEIRNEVYQAIIQGATAIGYFTHRFKPTFAEFGVPEENQKALREINAQLTRLAPVILSGEGKLQPNIEGLTGKCTGRIHDGAGYIFALNLDMKHQAGRATIRVPGLKAGTTVEVVDENRSVTADDDAVTDDFAPLAVHIYRFRR